MTTNKMKRRDFFKTGFLAGTGALLVPDWARSKNVEYSYKQSDSTKNIIFMVSDGMSIGTLNMADLLKRTRDGKGSNWLNLYRESKITRALMDTASANSIITDSAAASSSWGGGHRVPNGSINVGANGQQYQPILQKFKAAGKAVGCVTTVTVTHATPAGFCVNSPGRGSEDLIAENYATLDFDLFLGGGQRFFDPAIRTDKKDVYGMFRKAGFNIVNKKEELMHASNNQPILGLFSNDALPYAIDHMNDDNLKKEVPTLAEMTKKAIEKLNTHSNGFVLQIEGGKVDWAAHANDTSALLYDQLAFDEAVQVAIDFADRDKNTLVVITTDHGNANPGLVKTKNVDDKFKTLHNARQSNDWILHGIKRKQSVSSVIERIEYAQGITISKDEAKLLLSYYKKLDSEGLYNYKKLPFKTFAQIQSKYTGVGFAGLDHTADYVELAMFGPGSENLEPFVLNTEMHNFMLETTGVSVKR